MKKNILNKIRIFVVGVLLFPISVFSQGSTCEWKSLTESFRYSNLIESCFFNPEKQLKNSSMPTEDLIVQLLKFQNIFLAEAYQVANSLKDDDISSNLNEPGMGIGCERLSYYDAVFGQNSGLPLVLKAFDRKQQSNLAKGYQEKAKKLQEKLKLSVSRTNIYLQSIFIKNQLMQLKKGPPKRVLEEQLQKLKKLNPWIYQIELMVNKSKLIKNNFDFNTTLMQLLGTFPEFNKSSDCREREIENDFYNVIFYRTAVKILTDSKEFKVGKRRNFAIGTSAHFLKDQSNELILKAIGPQNDPNNFNFKKKAGSPYLYDENALKGAKYLSEGPTTGITEDYIKQLKVLVSKVVHQDLLLRSLEYEEALKLRGGEVKSIMDPKDPLGIDWLPYSIPIVSLLRNSTDIDPIGVVKSPKLASMYISFYEMIQRGVYFTFKCYKDNDFLLATKEEEKKPSYVITYGPKGLNQKRIGEKKYKRSDYEVFSSLEAPFIHEKHPNYVVNLYCGELPEEFKTLDAYLVHNHLDFLDVVLLNSAPYQVERLGEAIVTSLNNELVAEDLPIFSFDKNKMLITLNEEKLNASPISSKRKTEIRATIQFYNDEKDVYGLKSLLKMAKDYRFGFAGNFANENGEMIDPIADILHIQIETLGTNAATKEAVSVAELSNSFLVEDNVNWLDIQKRNQYLNYKLRYNAYDVKINLVPTSNVEFYFKQLEDAVNDMPVNAENFKLKINPIAPSNSGFHWARRKINSEDLEKAKILEVKLLDKIRTKAKILDLTLPTERIEALNKEWTLLESLALDLTETSINNINAPNLKRLALKLSNKKIDLNLVNSMIQMKNLSEMVLIEPDLNNALDFLTKMKELSTKNKSQGFNIKFLKIILSKEIPPNELSQFQKKIREDFKDLKLYITKE